MKAPTSSPLASRNDASAATARCGSATYSRLVRVVPTLLTIAAGCGGGTPAAHTQDAREQSIVGQTVPDLTLAPLHGGKELRTADLRGKTVLLDIWASWCAPCKEELPMLDDMAGRLAAKGIQIAAISIDDSRDDAEGFLNSRPSWSIAFAHDAEGKSLGILAPPKMPSSFIIDASGVIREVNAGFSREDAAKIESRLVEVGGGASAMTASASKAAGGAGAGEKGRAVAHPVPTSRGAIDGQPFAPKLGRIVGKVQKDGRALVSFTERGDCAPLSEGDAVLTLLVPWKEGYRAQLAPAKRGRKNKAVSLSFGRVNAARQTEISTTFKGKGTVAVVSAPAPHQGAGAGRVTLDVTSGGYRLAGDIDVNLCTSPE